MYGHTYKMSEAVAERLREAEGAEMTLYQIALKLARQAILHLLLKS